MKSIELRYSKDFYHKKKKKRAARFINTKLTNNFIINRGNLRLILAEKLDIAPEKLEFAYEKFGKPYVVFKNQRIPNFFFNLSHDKDLVVYAVANSAVGVDINYITHTRDFDGIVARFFTRAERELYFSCARNKRSKLFYELFACKEACLKACGTGLSGGFDKYQFDLASYNFPPKLLCNTWQLYKLNLGVEDYVGCVAI